MIYMMNHLKMATIEQLEIIFEGLSEEVEDQFVKREINRLVNERRLFMCTDSTGYESDYIAYAQNRWEVIGRYIKGSSSCSLSRYLYVDDRCIICCKVMNEKRDDSEIGEQCQEEHTQSHSKELIAEYIWRDIDARVKEIKYTLN